MLLGKRDPPPLENKTTLIVEPRNSEVSTKEDRGSRRRYEGVTEQRFLGPGPHRPSALPDLESKVAECDDEPKGACEISECSNRFGHAGSRSSHDDQRHCW